LVQLAKDNGDKPLPKTLFIQMDNAAGENKNKYVFGFLSNLVAKGVFETIVVSFLPVGHTHEDIDQIFSQLAGKLGETSLTLSLEEFDHLLSEVVRQSPKIRVPFSIIRSRAILDYKKFIDPYIAPGVKGHTKPHCFAFEAEIKDGLRSCLMRYREFSLSESWFPKPLMTDGVLHPDDVYASKEYDDGVEPDELFSEIEDDTAVKQMERIQHAVDEYTEKNAPRDKSEVKRQRKRQRKLERDFIDSKSEVNTDPPPAVDPASVLLDPKAIVYQGFGFLYHETDASKKSFLESPGLSFASRMVPALNTMECCPVANIQDAEELKCKQACIAFAKECQPFYTLVPDERVERALASWEQFFEKTYPHSVDDLAPSDYFMDWNCLNRAGETNLDKRASVIACEARQLIDGYTGGSNFRNQEPIQYAEKKERDTRTKVYKELADISQNRRPIDVNMFIICLRSKNDEQLQGDGFTSEEEALPFYLAKATAAVPGDCSSATLVPIVYWRQMEGDPNKTFIEGQFNDPSAAAGSGLTRLWRGTVERNSVLYVDPGFKDKKSGRSKVLNSTTLRELAELLNPGLRGWVFEPGAGAGLVFREPITHISIGDFFLVTWSATPNFLKIKAIKEELKKAGAVVVKANVGVEAAAAGKEVRSVADVTWFSFNDGDLNEKFKLLKPKRVSGEVTSEVSVSSLLRKISPAEARSKKLNWESKKKIVASKFPTLKNLWALDYDSKSLVAKAEAKAETKE
jgi:hypothetical protein